MLPAQITEYYSPSGPPPPPPPPVIPSAQTAFVCPLQMPLQPPFPASSSKSLTSGMSFLLVTTHLVRGGTHSRAAGTPVNQLLPSPLRPLCLPQTLPEGETQAQPNTPSRPLALASRPHCPLWPLCEYPPPSRCFPALRAAGCLPAISAQGQICEKLSSFPHDS